MDDIWRRRRRLPPGSFIFPPRPRRLHHHDLCVFAERIRRARHTACRQRAGSDRILYNTCIPGIVYRVLYDQTVTNYIIRPRTPQLSLNLSASFVSPPMADRMNHVYIPQLSHESREYTSEWDPSEDPGDGLDRCPTPTSPFILHGRFETRTAAALQGIQENPGDFFKMDLCSAWDSRQSGQICEMGRMCCEAHGWKQLRRRDGPAGDATKEEVDFSAMRSRVHLTLCWVSGYTLWVEDFPEAYRYVTGMTFEPLPGRAPRVTGASFPGSDAIAVTTDVLSGMCPDTCELFRRYDSRRGEIRMAVTLARGG